MGSVVCGLESYCAAPEQTGTVGLLTNVASLTRTGRTALRALSEAGVSIGCLFAPEHGYFGLGAAGESIADDQLGSLPIYSLYGAARAPGIEALQALSAVLIDLQDVGARWYTFLATVGHTLRACAAAHIPVIIFDRPNPLGGMVVEGLLAEPGFFSLVAPGAMPVRYGLTIAEAALWLNQIAKPEEQADLRVIPLRGWQRAMLFSETELHWAAPSPNMPHPETALLYTGTCLIEGTNLSEGRGTALPFEQIGAPFVQPEVLADALNTLSLPGIMFSPVWFRPTVSKYAGENCGGVRLFITDPKELRGFTVGLHIIATLRHLYPGVFTWAEWHGRNSFDTLAATPRLRPAIERDQSIAEIIAEADAQSQAFLEETKHFRLYPQYPQP